MSSSSGSSTSGTSRPASATSAVRRVRPKRVWTQRSRGIPAICPASRAASASPCSESSTSTDGSPLTRRETFSVDCAWRESRKSRTRVSLTPRGFPQAHADWSAWFSSDKLSVPSDLEGHMLSFGVTVLPDPPYTRFLELIELAEGHGFQYGWTYDSHILWQESTPLLTLAAARTKTLRLGHFVTNPGTREPTVLASMYATLHDISDGRMVMGIGRGDSARRVIGLQPVKVAEFERRCAMIKDLMNGRQVEWNEKELELKWVRKELPDIPIWVAGYGPKALAVAGRVGDGVIIQLADPVIIQWIMDTARRAAEESGRDPAELKCIVGAPSHISDDIADAREQSRWFPAMVSNHVMDLIERYGDDSEIPKDLTEFVKTRKFYDYQEHSRVGAKHGEFVTDEIVDRFCVLGNAAQATAKLKELESIGVDQFNIYLMTKGQEETLKAYGDEIIPEFTGVAA